MSCVTAPFVKYSNVVEDIGRDHKEALELADDRRDSRPEIDGEAEAEKGRD